MDCGNFIFSVLFVSFSFFSFLSFYLLESSHFLQDFGFCGCSFVLHVTMATEASKTISEEFPLFSSCFCSSLWLIAERSFVFEKVSAEPEKLKIVGANFLLISYSKFEETVTHENEYFVIVVVRVVSLCKTFCNVRKRRRKNGDFHLNGYSTHSCIVYSRSVLLILCTAGQCFSLYSIESFFRLAQHDTAYFSYVYPV